MASPAVSTPGPCRLTKADVGIVTSCTAFVGGSLEGGCCFAVNDRLMAVTVPASGARSLMMAADTVRVSLLMIPVSEMNLSPGGGENDGFRSSVLCVQTLEHGRGQSKETEQAER